MIKRFFEWLYFSEAYDKEYKTKIVKIKGINCFLTESKSGNRKTVWPVWDWKRISMLFKRVFRSPPHDG